MDAKRDVMWDARSRELLRCAGTARPQVGLKALLQTSDRGEVGPGKATHDVADTRVVDACERFRRAQTHTVHSPAQRERELPGDFSDGFRAGLLGPGDAGYTRSVTPGPGHVERLARPTPHAATALAGTHHESVGPESHTVGSNHHRQCEDIVARRIAHFTPDVDPAYWRVTESFVRGCVTDAAPATPYSASGLLHATSRFVLWTWQTAGLELDRAVVFSRPVISEYIECGCDTKSPASRGNQRSQLLRMAEALLGPEAAPPRLPPLPASNPVAPYSAADLITFCSWADGQTTTRRRQDCRVLLALAAGAGLSAHEIAALRTTHVRCDESGVLLAVAGSRARIVPVLHDWETSLVDAVNALSPDVPMFRPGHTGTPKNLTTNFLTKCNGVGARPQTQRLRATWIVTHLTACTPVVPFMGAAGVQSLEALTRYLRFVPGVDPALARERLRLSAVVAP